MPHCGVHRDPPSVAAPVFGQVPAPAAWIRPRLTGAWGEVTGPGTTPAGYDAYARLLHPVELDDRLVPWAEVAADTGTRIHPLVQWHRLCGVANEDAMDVTAEWRGSSPEEGNLHPEHLAELLDVLERHTSTADDCWFAVWDGWGGVAAVLTPEGELPVTGDAVWLRGAGPVERVSAAPWWAPWLGDEEVRLPEGAVRLPGRNYHLGRGPLRSALAIGEYVSTPQGTWFEPQSPNLCWPDDRAWFVASEIDFDSTLVAGTRHLVNDLLADDVLEAVEVVPGGLLTVTADTIN